MVRNHRLFARVYDPMIAPLERRELGARRRSLLAGLSGRVLEVGAGTGANLPYYPGSARLVLAEPDLAMRQLLSRQLAAAGRGDFVARS